VLVFLDAIDRAHRAIALQPKREDVLAVERERVPHGQAAVRREREILARPVAAPLEPHLVQQLTQYRSSSARSGTPAAGSAVRAGRAVGC
jgi:hypothetical protein